MRAVPIRRAKRLVPLAISLLFLCDQSADADCDNSQVPLPLASTSPPALSDGLVWPPILKMYVMYDGQHFELDEDSDLDSPSGESGPPTDVYWAFQLASPSPNGLLLTHLFACHAEECYPPPAAVPIPGAYMVSGGSPGVLGAEVTATMIAIHYNGVDGSVHDVRYGPFPQQ